MPTIQVSGAVFDALGKLRKETPDKERRFESYNAVIERLLLHEQKGSGISLHSTKNFPASGEKK